MLTRACRLLKSSDQPCIAHDTRRYNCGLMSSSYISTSVQQSQCGFVLAVFVVNTVEIPSHLRALAADHPPFALHHIFWADVVECYNIGLACSLGCKHGRMAWLGALPSQKRIRWSPCCNRRWISDGHGRCVTGVPYQLVMQFWLLRVACAHLKVACRCVGKATGSLTIAPLVSLPATSGRQECNRNHSNCPIHAITVKAELVMVPRRHVIPQSQP